MLNNNLKKIYIKKNENISFKIEILDDMVDILIINYNFKKEERECCLTSLDLKKEIELKEFKKYKKIIKNSDIDTIRNIFISENENTIYSTYFN